MQRFNSFTLQVSFVSQRRHFVISLEPNTEIIFKVLFVRTFLSIIRDETLTKLRLLSHIAIGLLIGTLYWDIGRSSSVIVNLYMYCTHDSVFLPHCTRQNKRISWVVCDWFKKSNYQYFYIHYIICILNNVLWSLHWNWLQRRCAMITRSSFLVHISQTDDINLWYFMI